MTRKQTKKQRTVKDKYRGIRAAPPKVSSDVQAAVDKWMQSPDQKRFKARHESP